MWSNHADDQSTAIILPAGIIGEVPNRIPINKKERRVRLSLYCFVTRDTLPFLHDNQYRRRYLLSPMVITLRLALQHPQTQVQLEQLAQPRKPLALAQ